MQSSVLTDGSRLSGLDQSLFRWETGLALLGGIIILLLVLLATSNVLGRWLFDLPINGYIDWVEQAMAFMAFLGIAYTQRQGAHIRMDIVLGQLRGRSLWFSEWLSSVLMFLLTLLLSYGAFLHFQRAYQIGDSSLDIDLPTWPAKLVVPVALLFLALRLLLQIVAYTYAWRKNASRMIAVPMLENAAEAAAREAESLLKRSQQAASTE